VIDRTDLPDVFDSPHGRKGTWWLRHAILSVSFVAVYLLLNRPEIILISKLGFTTWYPAAGLIFALMLGVSPWYALLVCFADSLAAIAMYHQPLFSWSGLVAPISSTSFYALAAILLRGRLQINPDLRRRQDVVRYTVVTLVAAIGSTICGVTSLILDHGIARSDYWHSALGWYVGDVVGLLGCAPFLLIYVLPWVRKNVAPRSTSPPPSDAGQVKVSDMVEGAAQAMAIVGVLWVMFGRTLAPYELFYLSFVPIIWTAMRNGIERATIAILVLDFGIVAALHFYPAAPSVVAKAGLLMLVVSATGLIVGSAVSERQHIGKELKQRTVYLDSLTENSPFGIVALDQAGKVELYNRAFEELFGFERIDLVGKKLDSLIYGDQIDDRLELSPRVYEGQSVQSTARRKRNDESLVDVEIHVVPLVIDGKVRGSYALYKDISDVLKAAQERNEQGNILKRSLAELQSRTNEMTLLIELSAMLQCCNTLDEAYSVVSQFGEKLFFPHNSGSLSVFKSSRNVLELAAGWGTSSNISMTFSPDNCWALRRGKPHWSSTSSAGLICNHLKDNIVVDRVLCIPMVAQGDTIGVLQLHVASGSESKLLDENLQITLERIASSAAGQIALSIASLKLREALKDQSIRDPLTGLYNRRFMHDFLERELLRARRTNRPFAVMFIDLDHFKRFNDSFGHDAGDFVLQSFTKLLTSHFRGSDIICRYGGEEFALVLPDSSLIDAEIRADDLRTKVRQLAISHRETALGPITCSVGIAEFPEDGSTAEELLRVADKFLYEAKTQGRDRSVTQVKLLPPMA
jgi:diguanylate cyclase (GGDEF)-like protein/PAS domain S-box-containing protein